MQRRTLAGLVGVARTAASSALAAEQATTSSSRAAWLRPLGIAAAPAASGASPAAAAPALAAAAACSPHLARGISISSAARHNAEPAAAAQQQQPREYERTCWQCGTPLSGGDLFFCPSCGSVLPASMDSQYFQVFGMDEPRFDLDLSQLEKTYRDLQRQLHPDKYSQASSFEQEYAHQQAAVVNQAYDVLKKPLRRAHYILSQQGMGACEGMTITDPELLMRVMEAREEVEEAGDDQAQLQPLLDNMRGLHASTVQDLVGAFGAGDLHRAAELTTQLRYICRIEEAILDKM